TGLKMLLTGIFEFESPIPQSFAMAATGAHAITAIVNHQRCTSAYKIVRSSRVGGRRRGSAVEKSQISWNQYHKRFLIAKQKSAQTGRREPSSRRLTQLRHHAAGSSLRTCAS